ncbi:NAD-dependent epimerase/dehydratase family protein [Mucilaginibacter limnophilus]|uniref:NAD-dependent epimerase/dehydratase family protein n=1 Tax=Mucilaginibacter limnophilus TaxID=1932778 RepID=A0A3S2VN59_9SPHI|nr:NAD(P)H-binding protein [Mucilaginibacter limnophilus]RVU01295.1 NAD-dependent epimerase/dehydratase family protein [Mucilaginibacter limnophilus]
MVYKAIIFGASGLIGSKLLPMLLQHPQYGEVLAVSRKELPVQHEKLSQAIINLNDLEQYASLINGHAIFCCLGTTQSQTPDRDIYYKIDHNYPVTIAKLAAHNRVEHFHFISAIGANDKSSNFYLRTKGQAEQDLKLSGINSLHIYQPSFLKGRNDGSRPAEVFINGLMNLVNPLLIGGLKKYRSIKSETVAQAMLNQSLNNKTGVFTYTTDKIKELV